MSIEVMTVLGSAIGGLISFFCGYSVGRWAKSRAFKSSVLERDVQRIVVNPRSDNPRTFVPESENAKLREQYEAVFADYRSEVAKLRELVRHMYECMCNVDADGNYECYSCEYENTDGNCDFERRMQELGVEVSA